MCWNKVKQMGYAAEFGSTKSPAKSPKISSSKCKPPIPLKCHSSPQKVKLYYEIITAPLSLSLNFRGGGATLGLHEFHPWFHHQTLVISPSI